MEAASPYIDWARTRPAARFDLAGSQVLACTIADLPGARDLSLDAPDADVQSRLTDAIARRYEVPASSVTLASGASGANLLACATLLEPGDNIIVESPGYEPLLSTARLFGATITRIERRMDAGYALDPDRVRRALTPRTRLIAITTPHNPTGVAVSAETLRQIGRIAGSAGAQVLVDEVYLDCSSASRPPASTLGDVFITTSSLTKSYGLSSLRCGWVMASPNVTARLRQASGLLENGASTIARQLSVAAFAALPSLAERASNLLAANHAAVRELLGDRRDLLWVEPDGGPLIFPRISGLDDCTAFCERLLTERQTAVVPGHFFGAPAHFRVGTGGDPALLRKGLAAVAQALDARAFHQSRA
jgi:aspartate/methionine/tyrosine aminotransferase